MSLRTFVNEYPVLTAGITVALLMSAIGYFIYSVRASDHYLDSPKTAFFTTDDGATTFVDSATNIPPFDHQGQSAVRAYQFTADNGQHHWVQYLQKYPDAVEKGIAPAATQQPTDLGQALVKRPGERTWVSESSAHGIEIITPKAPANMGNGEVTQFAP
jgi:hypothetical protein